jgi:hypothetical protein
MGQEEGNIDEQIRCQDSPDVMSAGKPFLDRPPGRNQKKYDLRI